LCLKHRLEKAKKLLPREVGTNGKGEDTKRRSQKVNMVDIFCTHVCKWKNETCCEYSSNRGKRDTGR
jgi:hypothetical protein